MNDTVTRLVDALFSQVEMTQEAQAMHDELMANCQERFSDLVAQGHSEDEAAALVMESLKGMEEVIAGYPKKPAPGAKTEDEPRSYYTGRDMNAGSFAELGKRIAREVKDAVKASTDFNDFKDMGEQIAKEVGDAVQQETDKWSRPSDGAGKEEHIFRKFDPALTQRISCSVRSYDVVIEPASGDEIELEYDTDPSGDEEIVATHDGGALRIDTRSGYAKGKNNGWGWFTSRFVSIHRSSDTLTLRLPASASVSFTAHSQSGDMELRGVRIKDADLSTSSGDVTLRPALSDRLADVSVNSASGDIDIELAANSIRAKSMSGDVNIRCDAQTASVSSVSGDVSYVGRFVSGDIKSVSGDVDIHCLGDEVERVDARSTSGDVSITLPESVAYVEGKCSSVSGDVSKSLPKQGEGKMVTVFASSVSGDVNVTK